MDKVTLSACPPGLFRFNGMLCFKSEYVTTLENPRRYQCDAYVVESGEYFHGGTAGDVLARSNLLVEPLATPAPDSEKLREAIKRLDEHSVHIGYDERGNFIWEDCVSRTEVLAALGASA